MSKKKNDKYAELATSLETLPHVSPVQVQQWVELQQSIDKTRDYLIRAVPEAQGVIAVSYVRTGTDIQQHARRRGSYPHMYGLHTLEVM